MRGVWVYRGKATGAFAEAGVVDKTHVVGDTAPLQAACAAVQIIQQFVRMLRW